MVMLSNLENMDFNEWVEIAKMYIGNHFKIIEAEDNSVRYSGMQIISEHAMDFNGSYEFTEDPGTIIKLSSNGKLFSGEINGEGGYTFQLMNDYILYSADNEVFVELIRATETEDKHIIWNEGGEWPAYEVRERSEKELMNYVAYYYCSEINATYSIDIHNGALFLSTGFGTEYKLISTGPMSFSNTTWLLDNVAFVTNEKNEIIAFLLDAYDVKGLYFEKMN
jgi:hypothetical protein